MELKKIKVIFCGEEKEIVVNLRKSFKLSPYRLKVQEKSNLKGNLKGLNQNLINELRSIDRKNLDFSKLSPEAQEFLISSTTNIQDVFEYEDLVEILKIIFEIEEDEAVDMLELNYSLCGFDETIDLTIAMLEEVFTSAKDTSEKKAMSKKELNRVASK